MLESVERDRGETYSWYLWLAEDPINVLSGSKGSGWPGVVVSGTTEDIKKVSRKIIRDVKQNLKINYHLIKFYPDWSS